MDLNERRNGFLRHWWSFVRLGRGFPRTISRLWRHGFRLIGFFCLGLGGTSQHFLQYFLLSRASTILAKVGWFGVIHINGGGQDVCDINHLDSFTRTSGSISAISKSFSMMSMSNCICLVVESVEYRLNYICKNRPILAPFPTKLSKAVSRKFLYIVAI